jgi:MSHA pilin protein MshD
MLNKHRMAGVTLVELVVAMVIVGVALAGLVSVYNRASIASTDPLITQQMLAIGETMMEEVMLKPYVGNNVREALRAQYDELDDYTSYAKQAVTDVDGNAVAGLERYQIGVTVGTAPQTLPGVATTDVKRIVVTVWNGNQNLVLTGWRTRPLL